MQTRAPSCASRRAMPRPMRFAAPVTSTTWFLSGVANWKRKEYQQEAGRGIRSQLDMDRRLKRKPNRGLGRNRDVLFPGRGCAGGACRCSCARADQSALPSPGDRAEDGAQSRATADQDTVALLMRAADLLVRGGRNVVLAALETERIHPDAQIGAARQAAGVVGTGHMPGESCPGRDHGLAAYYHGTRERRMYDIACPVPLGTDVLVETYGNRGTTGNHDLLAVCDGLNGFSFHGFR